VWETQKEVPERKLRSVGKASSKYWELSTANESARILVLSHIFRKTFCMFGWHFLHLLPECHFCLGFAHLSGERRLQKNFGDRVFRHTASLFRGAAEVFSRVAGGIHRAGRAATWADTSVRRKDLLLRNLVAWVRPSGKDKTGVGGVFRNGGGRESSEG
jgi:hypothetical protein